MRVFVSDVAGYIGRPLSEALMAEGHSVTGSVVPKLDHVGDPVEPDVATGVTAIPAADARNLRHLVTTADAVVCPMQGLVDETVAVLKAMRESPREEPQRFIGVSSVLTWAKTARQQPATGEVAAEEPDQEQDADQAQQDAEDEPKDPEDEEKEDEEPHILAEQDFMLRKPANSFSALKTLETQVMSAASDALRPCVVAAGLLFGEGEDWFGCLFKEAWLHGDDPLPVPARGGGRGNNALPTLHVRDLAALLAGMLARAPDAAEYVVAAAPGPVDTLRGVVQALADEMGCGRVRDCSANEAGDLLVEHRHLPRLQADLRFALPTGYVARHLLPPSEDEAEEGEEGDEQTDDDDLPKVSLRAPNGLAGYMAQAVAEFKAAHQLRPLRVVVLGPPSSGKTHYAEKLAREYRLEHVTLQSAIDAVLAPDPEVEAEQKEDQQDRSDTPATEATDASSDAEADEEDAAEPPPDRDPLRAELREFLDAPRDPKSKVPEGVPKELPSELLARCVRRQLLRPACRSKGFVLDGVPASFADAQAIFTEPAAPEPAEGEEEGGGGEPEPAEGDEGAEAPGPDPAVAPSNVIVLSGHPDVFKARAMAAATDDDDVRAAEQVYAHRVARFEEAHSVDAADTPVGYFERECRLEVLEVAVGHDEELALRAESAEADAATGRAARRGSAASDPDGYGSGADGEGGEGGADAPRALPEPAVADAMAMYVERGGRPANFYPTAEMILEERRRQKLEADTAAAEAAKLAAEQRKREEEEKRQRADADARRLRQLQAEEAQQLEARSVPLRNFLMQNVIPALTEAMLEVVQVQPEDPIDYVAEYLFKKAADFDDRTEILNREFEEAEAERIRLAELAELEEEQAQLAAEAELF